MAFQSESVLDNWVLSTISWIQVGVSDLSYSIVQEVICSCKLSEEGFFVWALDRLLAQGFLWPNGILDFTPISS